MSRHRAAPEIEGFLAALGFARPDWWADAACRGQGSERWFPERPGPTAESREAKAICATCPVRRECLARAVELGLRYGIFGGLTEIERRGLRPGTKRDWRTRAAEERSA